MLAKKLNDTTWLIRLLSGEELLEAIRDFCQREGIRLGSFTGIGAMAEVELSAFLHDEKTYARRSFAGSLEIVSLHGNISTLDGAVFLHVHMAVGDEGLAMVGGHVHRAVIHPTAEIILQIYPGSVERALDRDSGLNLLQI